MSEYQYYEFLAIDRPLDAKQMAALRMLSTRAEITSTRFTNVYHWGDFKGSPEKLMERYFDAHVYVANWGTHILMLRLPKAVLSKETLAPYCVDEGLRGWTKGEHLIIEWRRDGEPPDELTKIFLPPLHREACPCRTRQTLRMKCHNGRRPSQRMKHVTICSFCYRAKPNRPSERCDSNTQWPGKPQPHRRQRYQNNGDDPSASYVRWRNAPVPTVWNARDSKSNASWKNNGNSASAIWQH